MLRKVLVPEFCSDVPVPKAVVRIRPYRLTRAAKQAEELGSVPS